ncbi:U-box domain-containing protein [Planoprotostelium fungivorum]|uniref:U-box domain-containing protein n=1 Tax=Planoprotostelium fungivorum TaxID=1890364 RepID=A0A2P6NW75_9EUKA|nr:U-box domain-containing protein [Planoprotostelium fungivorum]
MSFSVNGWGIHFFPYTKDKRRRRRIVHKMKRCGVTSSVPLSEASEFANIKTPLTQKQPQAVRTIDKTTTMSTSLSSSDRHDCLSARLTENELDCIHRLFTNVLLSPWCGLRWYVTYVLARSPHQVTQKDSLATYRKSLNVSFQREVTNSGSWGRSGGETLGNELNIALHFAKEHVSTKCSRGSQLSLQHSPKMRQTDHSTLEIGERIGEGGYGRVFHATVGATDVVLKTMTKTPSRSTEGMARREFDFGMKLKHPNLVRMRGSFDTATDHCLVMDVVKGCNLYDCLQKNSQEH